MTDRIWQIQDEQKKIKDLEIKVSGLRLNIHALTKEIEFLIALETQLKENIEILKSKYIISMAVQYRRTKENLEYADKRLKEAITDKNRYIVLAENYQAELDEKRKSFRKLVKQLDNNVIHAQFGSKNGQK